MAEENIITRTTKARADLARLRNIVGQVYSILCARVGWNPREGMSEDEIEEEAKNNITPTQLSNCKDLVLLSPDDLEDRLRAKRTVDAAIVESCRAYAKKIAQLTHPDKLMRFSAQTKAELLEVFHQSHKDLYDNNRAGLIYGYIHVRILRGESHKVPEELYSHVEDEYNWTSNQMQFILRQKFIPAVNAYCDGQQAMAKVLFKQYIELVRKERARKKAFEKAMADLKAAYPDEEPPEEMVQKLLTQFKEDIASENNPVGSDADRSGAQVADEEVQTAAENQSVREEV